MLILLPNTNWFTNTAMIQLIAKEFLGKETLIMVKQLRIHFDYMMKITTDKKFRKNKQGNSLPFILVSAIVPDSVQLLLTKITEEADNPLHTYNITALYFHCNLHCTGTTQFHRLGSHTRRRNLLSHTIQCHHNIMHNIINVQKSIISQWNKFKQNNYLILSLSANL